MIIGKEVTGKDFIGRKKELAMIKKLVGKNNIAVYGPRRIGKTSLMLEAARRYESKYVWTHLDVRRTVPIDSKTFTKSLGMHFLEMYSNATGEKLLPLLEKMKMNMPELLGRVKISIRDWVDLSLAPNRDITAFVKRTFEMGEDLAQRCKKDFLVLIDELPAMVRMSNGKPDPHDMDFLWTVRGYLGSAKHVHYIVSGSETGMMEHLCGSKESPFYGSLIPIKLGGLDKDEAEAFLGKHMPKRIVDAVAQETHCFPLYVQAYSAAAALGAHTLDGMRESAFGLLHLHFIDLENHLSPQQRLILTVMAKKDINEAKKVAKETGIAYTTVYTNLLRTVNTGFLEKTKTKGYEFTDPMFKMWLAGYAPA